MSRASVILALLLAFTASACIVDLGPYGKQDCNPKQTGPNSVDASTIVCTPIAR